MRPWLALSLVVCLVAGPAGAQALRGAMKVPPASVSASDRAKAAAAAKPTTPAPLPAAPPPALMSMVPGRDPPLCRPSCSRSYYFCLAAGDANEDCAGAFGQCNARCDRTGGYSPLS